MNKDTFKLLKLSQNKSAQNKSAQNISNDINKNIYILWYQGFINAPDVVRICVYSWQINNPDYNVILLDKNNLANYTPTSSLAASATTDTTNASNITSGSLPNARLANNSITINGTSVSLGGSTTIQVGTFPTITSISPSTITNDATSFTITGTNFVSVPIVEAINSSTGAISG